MLYWPASNGLHMAPISCADNPQQIGPSPGILPALEELWDRPSLLVACPMVARQPGAIGQKADEAHFQLTAAEGFSVIRLQLVSIVRQAREASSVRSTAL